MIFQDGVQFVKGTDFVVGGKGRFGLLAARVVPAGGDAGVFAALDVGCEGVADDQGFVGGKVRDGVEYGAEVGDVGFLVADGFRDEDAVETGVQTAACKAAVLGDCHAVGDAIEPVFSGERLAECFGAVDEVVSFAEGFLVVAAEGGAVDGIARFGEKTGEARGGDGFLGDFSPLESGPQTAVDGVVQGADFVGDGQPVMSEGDVERVFSLREKSSRVLSASSSRMSYGRLMVLWCRFGRGYVCRNWPECLPRWRG